MDRFFSFLSRNKSVFSLKNRSRTGKTDDFSSPAVNMSYLLFPNNPIDIDPSYKMDLISLGLF